MQFMVSYAFSPDTGIMNSEKVNEPFPVLLKAILRTYRANVA